MLNVHCNFLHNSLNSVSGLSYAAEHDSTFIQLLFGEMRVTNWEVGCIKQVPRGSLVDGDIGAVVFFHEQGVGGREGKGEVEGV